MKKVGLVSLGCAKNRVELIAMPPGSDVDRLKLEVSPDTGAEGSLFIFEPPEGVDLFDAEGNSL